jgi:uncharacterized protein (DUF58 family)
VSAPSLRDALLRGRRRPQRYGSGSPTSYRGDGYEFVELRAYVEGDDVRRIDWAASARAGALQSRVVLEDVALTLAVIVDDTPSMLVGRTRSLFDAAADAYESWLAAALSSDRIVRVDAGAIVHPRVPPSRTFDLREALETARAGLRRGSALLAISDWYDLNEEFDDLLAQLGARCDCTALYARDPWYDGLPLGGFVRIRGAEGGMLRAYIGKREREAFARNVRAREEALVARFERTGWRCAPLLEANGTASLRSAFGLPV